MTKYYVDELTTESMRKILGAFQTQNLPKLKKWKNYYDGKQAIIYRKPTYEGKPNNIVVVNYCSNILDTLNGYLTGIPVKYNTDESMKDITDILTYNDYHTEDNTYMHNCLCYGIAYELCYIDEDGKQRFKTLDSREVVPVYKNNLNEDLIACIRFYRESLQDKASDSYIVEVYDDVSIRTYRSGAGWQTFELISDVPHYYKQCPVTVFELNDDRISCFDKIMTLQDTYNIMVSDEANDISSFADAYMVLKGIGGDEDDFKSMKENRILIMDSDSSAEYLTKNVNDNQVQNMLTNLNDQIHKISQVPDFNDETFMAQSGIAIKYKIFNMEDLASNIAANFKKALQRRIELICGVEELKFGESVWRDIEIVISRNLPDTLIPTTVTELLQLKGLVSDETLISLLPFIKNPEKEHKKVVEETKASMQLYDFGNDDIDDEVDNNETKS